MRVRYTDHLVDLLCRAESAAGRIAGADPDRRAEHARAARRASARLSARLDASPLTEATAESVDAREAEGLPPVEADVAALPERDERGSWAKVLKLDDMATQDVAALEYANALRCFDAEPAVAEWFFERPVDALAELHRVLVDGLVDPADAGRPRRTEQAVHDGSLGKIVYNAPAPELLSGLLGELADWLSGAGGRPGSARLPTLVVAGVVHERILEWQPFEAANGRLARAASRVVLRARGVDPHGCAVIEAPLAADPLAYYAEVAATMRRGDLGPWLERWSEAAAEALEVAADAVDPRPRPDAPGRARAVVGELDDGAAITLAEYATRAGVGFETARADVRALMAAGLLRAQPRTQGLRFVRVGEPRP